MLYEEEIPKSQDTEEENKESSSSSSEEEEGEDEVSESETEMVAGMYGSGPACGLPLRVPERAWSSF